MKDIFSPRNWTIKWKLRLIIYVTSIFLCLTSGIMIIWFQGTMLRKNLFSDLSGLAQVLGKNSASALLFRDPDSAIGTLSGLQSRKSIQSAAIYDKEGQLFAIYKGSDKSIPLPDQPATEGPVFTDEYLTLTHTIEMDGERIGTIYLLANLEELHLVLWKSAVIDTLVIIVALLLAGIIAAKLEGLVYSPIKDMAHTATEISKRRDYSLRARKESQDELGMLVDAFNDMLVQIQSRDSQLQKHQDELEKIVHDRTIDLKEANEKLSLELRERKKIEKELRIARDKAEEATKLKDKFVALVSHDLKSPLAVVSGYFQLLSMNELDYKTIKELCADGIDACEDMDMLIMEFLSLTRIMDGKLKPDMAMTDICEIVHIAIEDQRGKAFHKGINLINEIPEKASLLVDEKLILEVMRNLVSNSVKFCSKGDKVRIYLPEGEPSTVAVEDTGLGIEPERIEMLFTYEQKTSSLGTSGERGTGFGLPLVKDIVEAHGGTLHVESVPGKGCTFFVRLLSDI